MLTNGKTDTSYQDSSLQGQNRPHDKKSTVEKVEHIGRDETIFLSKFATKKKAINNQHNFMFRKVAESDRKPVAAVSGFKGGSKPKTQSLKNATEIFKHEDWISFSAKDTKTYGESEEALMNRDLVMTHKKSQQDAFLGVNRSIVTDGGGGTYNYAPLDADPLLAAQMSLIAGPIWRTGEGTNPADASQMAGIFHYIANTDLPQIDVNNNNYRDLSDFKTGWLGNIKAFDASKNWKGAKTSITKKHINLLIRKMIDAGVKPDNGAFDLYAGGDLTEAIAELYSSTRRSDMKDKEIGYMVEIIVTQFGKARIHYMPEFNDVNGLDDVILMGNFTYAGKSYLSETRKSNPATNETAELLRYYSDLTLEVNNAYAFTAGVGLKA